MAKKRDYKAEYARRIAHGISRGLTRSQAAGHPKKGETKASRIAFVNPFKEMKNTVSEFISNIQKLTSEFPKSTFNFPCKNEIEYVEMHDNSGVQVLPRWSIGSAQCPPKLEDIRSLMSEVTEKRFQRGYAVVICGYLEEEYPGHEGEGIVCLSYRINRMTITRALENKNITSVDKLLDEITSPDRTEQWLEVHMFQVIDKE